MQPISQELVALAVEDYRLDQDGSQIRPTRQMSARQVHRAEIIDKLKRLVFSRGGFVVGT
jgi:hypothetical protein